MALTTSISANEIINRVAVEVGLAPVTDVFATDDPSFLKLKYFLDTAGEELLQAYAWEFLVQEHQIETAAGDDGVYDLPDDFGYMLNQTGWERNQNVPLGGPLTAQDWAYLKGRDLVSSTIYASFRVAEGKYNIFPQPPPEGLDINFEYISTNWCRSAAEPFVYRPNVLLSTDIVLYDKTLITRYVKTKYLESVGFDTTKAQDDFNQCFSFLTGKDKGASILNAGRRNPYPYLSAANVPFTGFGI